MTLEELEKGEHIIFKCISGSRVQGLASTDSDTDIRGVFILPKEEYFGLDYTPQVSDETNDTVYYEVGRFVELLTKNNPNALELLCTPDEFIVKRHPLMDRLRPDLFVSTLCRQSFSGYASTQISKAKGLNKKMNNPMPERRATVIDFCFVTDGQHSRKLTGLLEKNGWDQSDCGLIKMARMPDMYALFHNPTLGYNGVMREGDSNDVCLSSVPKKEDIVCHLYFSKSAYSRYCREHREYWEWVSKRNESRYNATKSHGKNYDAKNMMHTIRLLRMAKEIGETGEINVNREDREHLLLIKSGEFSYEELIDMSEVLLSEIELAFTHSNLPTEPDVDHIDELLSELRMEFYSVSR